MFSFSKCFESRVNKRIRSYPASAHLNNTLCDMLYKYGTDKYDQSMVEDMLFGLYKAKVKIYKTTLTGMIESEDPFLVSWANYFNNANLVY